MSPRLVVIGSTNVDLFTHVARHPSPGETVLGEGGVRSPGGKGANQALAAALQGAQVSFVGAVGDDPDADVALTSLRDAGVDLGLVATVPGPTGLAVITVSADGENTIVVVPGATAKVTAEDAISALGKAGPDDLLLMQGELPRETTEAAVRHAREAGLRVVLNSAPWVPLEADVLTTAHPLVVNEHEAAEAIRELGGEPSRDPVAMAGALLRHGAPSVVITLGAAGAVVTDGSQPRVIPSPRVEAVDTTGAGDAFTGALAARLVNGAELDEAVAHAVRVGAYAVQHPAAQPSYPRGEEGLP